MLSTKLISVFKMNQPEFYAPREEVPEHLRYVDNYSPTPSNAKYKIIRYLDRGGFGVVYEACLVGEEETGQRFAVKKKLIRGIGSGCGITNSERQEAHALRILQNEDNIVKLVEIIREPTSLSIVMSLAKVDLNRIIYMRNMFIGEDEKRIILNQYFKGLDAIHRHRFIHRDIKPANVLVTSQGIIQIADFGMSVQLEAKSQKMNLRVGTSYYRAPELLFGDEEYDHKIDIWASGCMATELWSRRTLFCAMGKSAHIGIISATCGFPTRQVWPRVTSLKDYRYYRLVFGRFKKNQLHPTLLMITNGFQSPADLLLKLLQMNPADRLDTSQALQHEYFTSLPVGLNVKSLVERYCCSLVKPLNFCGKRTENRNPRSSEDD